MVRFLAAALLAVGFATPAPAAVVPLIIRPCVPRAANPEATAKLVAEFLGK